MSISVIIPARNDRLLIDTVESVCVSTSRQDLEFVIVLDGETEYPFVPFQKNMTIIQNKEPQGIRQAINKAVENSHGDYLLKLDAHCIVDNGFIEKLKCDYKDGQVMVARRYTLDLNTMRKAPRMVDYFYLSCPWTHPRGTLMMQSCPWITHTGNQLCENIIDDLMCFQGSMWFMSREHWDWLGGLQTDLTYAEHHEISMKTWLGGRRVVTNKNTWYAHPSKPVSGYHMSMSDVYRDHDLSAKYWTTNQWEGRVHDFDWLINKFWPLPTQTKRHRTEKYYWEEDWEKYYAH